MRGFVQILLQHFCVFKGIVLKGRRKESLYWRIRGKERALRQLSALHVMGGCCSC